MKRKGWDRGEPRELTDTAYFVVYKYYISYGHYCKALFYLFRLFWCQFIFEK